MATRNKGRRVSEEGLLAEAAALTPKRRNRRTGRLEEESGEIQEEVGTEMGGRKLRKRGVSLSDVVQSVAKGFENDEGKAADRSATGSRSGGGSTDDFAVGEDGFAGRGVRDGFAEGGVRRSNLSEGRGQPRVAALAMEDALSDEAAMSDRDLDMLLEGEDWEESLPPLGGGSFLGKQLPKTTGGRGKVLSQLGPGKPTPRQSRATPRNDRATPGKSYGENFYSGPFGGADVGVSGRGVDPDSDEGGPSDGFSSDEDLKLSLVERRDSPEPEKKPVGRSPRGGKNLESMRQSGAKKDLGKVKEGVHAVASVSESRGKQSVRSKAGVSSDEDDDEVRGALRGAGTDAVTETRLPEEDTWRRDQRLKEEAEQREKERLREIERLKEIEWQKEEARRRDEEKRRGEERWREERQRKERERRRELERQKRELERQKEERRKEAERAKEERKRELERAKRESEENEEREEKETAVRAAQRTKMGKQLNVLKRIQATIVAAKKARTGGVGPRNGAPTKPVGEGPSPTEFVIAAKLVQKQRSKATSPSAEPKLRTVRVSMLDIAAAAEEMSPSRAKRSSPSGNRPLSAGVNATETSRLAHGRSELESESEDEGGRGWQGNPSGEARGELGGPQEEFGEYGEKQRLHSLPRARKEPRAVGRGSRLDESDEEVFPPLAEAEPQLGGNGSFLVASGVAAGAYDGRRSGSMLGNSGKRKTPDDDGDDTWRDEDRAIALRRKEPRASKQLRMADGGARFSAAPSSRQDGGNAGASEADWVVDGEDSEQSGARETELGAGRGLYRGAELE